MTKNRDWHKTMLYLVIIALLIVLAQTMDYNQQKVVVYALPKEVADLLPDDELTTSVVTMKAGKLHADKHTSIPDEQRLARIELAHPLKPRSTYK